jgi:hypothetical protein
MVFSINNLTEKIDELEAKVSAVSDQLNTIWATITSRRLADLPLFTEKLDRTSTSLLGLDLNSLAKRIGFIVGRGEGLSSVEKVLSATLERSVGKAWEKFVKGTIGSAILGSFLAGAGVALIDSLFSEIKRAIKPRRLNLPELEEIPRGGFPRFSSYREVLPASWFRPEGTTKQAIKSQSRTALSAGELIEKVVAERLRSFVN